MARKSKTMRQRARLLDSSRQRNFEWEIRYRMHCASRDRGNNLRMSGRRLTRFRSAIDFHAQFPYVPVKLWAGAFLSNRPRNLRNYLSRIKETYL